MKCPYCSNEMKKGFLQSRDGLGWSQKKRIIAAFSELFADQPLGKTVVAYLCGDCQKIVIDYNNDEK